MKRTLIGLVAAVALAAGPALGAEKVKIGFMTTLSGPAGIIGTPMKNAFELGLEHVGGKVGGLETEIVYGDDQQKPDVGKQVVDGMLKKDRVDFVTGIIWSNVLAAIYKSTIREDVFLISSNAGWHVPAGAECAPNFFNVAFQNDTIPEGAGKYLQDQGVTNVYTIAPNYQAGKDMMTGFARYYKGTYAGQVFTQLGQSDYQAEITALRAAKPSALFVFLPGGMGINFIKQYAQAGLLKEIPMYSAYTVDSISLPALKDAAVGTFGLQHWSPDLDNPVNKRFVKEYRERHGAYPVFYAAQAYDTVMFLDAAIRKAGGIKDRKKLQAAMESGDFPSVRGKIEIGNNHFVIQNIYLREAVKLGEDDYTTQIREVVLPMHKDAYHQDCKMTKLQ